MPFRMPEEIQQKQFRFAFRADEMAKYCMGRRTVVFLPLVKTSRKFRDILNGKGFASMIIA